MGFTEKLKESGNGLNAIFVIAFLGIVWLMIFGNLSLTEDAFGDNRVSGGNVLNNSDGTTMASGLALSNETFINFANSTIVGLNKVGCSLFNITNASDNSLIGSGNYTIGGTGNCFVKLVDGTIPGFNASLFNSSYSFSYNDYLAPDTLISNVTEGSVVFFGFAPTWFTIMAIVLLIVLLLSLLAIVLKIAGSSKKGGFGE